ncbi:MAG: hypothetical protein KJO07_22910, partial [Deltaproteobacteria bacterium]|nr:hypothetical protein [Deltaproteobacteria bacterium]
MSAPKTWSVPLELFRDMPIVTVVDPRGQSHEFLVDTGASFTVLDKRIAPAFSPTPYIGEDGKPLGGMVETAGAGRADLGNLHVISELVVGDFKLEGEVGVHLADLSMLERVSGRKVVGILGFQSLQMPVTIDYPARMLRVHERLPRLSGPGLPLIDSDSLYHPVIEVEIGGKKVPTLIDTGSGKCMGVPRELARSVGFESPPVPTGYSQTLSGVIEDRSARLR